ncbi:MAG TPA: (d)CMP kinase, partial [Burkholderiales bacterium]|nr:(d)CMP kinase [Burkholderiales bacterium]
AIYRVLGLAAERANVNLEKELEVLHILLKIKIKFINDRVFLDAADVSNAIRDETISDAASKVSAHAEVRRALLARQREFRQEPGLVADGRDMGSVIFPDSVLKIYLTASPEARAKRRYKQLIDKGLDANMTALLQDIKRRDQRDSGRAAAPLQKGVDAIEVDTTDLSAAQAIGQIIGHYRAISGKS